MGHGTDDPVVPVQLAEASRATLEKRGYRVQWHAWPMPHSVCAEEVIVIAEFLMDVLGSPGMDRKTPSAILLP